MLLDFRINELIWQLSQAIDYVGITDTHHGKRVAYYASEISRHLDLDYSYDDIISACLLHDCGVSSTDTHERLALTMPWDKVASHCIRGAVLLKQQPLFAHLAPVIAHHHSDWNYLKNTEIPEREKELANLIFLADRLDILITNENGPEILSRSDDIIDRIQAMGPELFAPQFVQAFEEAAQAEYFWFTRSGEELAYYFKEWFQEQQIHAFGYDELIQLFSLFASCVDGKSSFTADHSWGVRNAALYISELAGIGIERNQQIGIAALLHDLGKLRVPDRILAKPGALDKDELYTMKHHSYDTHRILSKIPGFKDIALWAASHHEKLDGSGYPFRFKANQISIESRIISVADIFQALIQERPYRKNILEPETIKKIIQDLADTGKIDGDISALVIKNYEECKYRALAAHGAENPASLTGPLTPN